MIRLCLLSDLNEGDSLGFDITDKPVFAVRKDGKIFVYHNECPHLGVELEFQENRFLDMDGALIECSTHGALFEIETGHCLSGPCHGDYLKPADFTVKDDVLYLVTSQ